MHQSAARVPQTQGAGAAFPPLPHAGAAGGSGQGGSGSFMQASFGNVPPASAGAGPNIPVLGANAANALQASAAARLGFPPSTLPPTSALPTGFLPLPFSTPPLPGARSVLGSLFSSLGQMGADPYGTRFLGCPPPWNPNPNMMHHAPGSLQQHLRGYHNNHSTAGWNAANNGGKGKSVGANQYGATGGANQYGANAGGANQYANNGGAMNQYHNGAGKGVGAGEGSFYGKGRRRHPRFNLNVPAPPAGKGYDTASKNYKTKAKTASNTTEKEKSTASTTGEVKESTSSSVSVSVSGCVQAAEQVTESAAAVVDEVPATDVPEIVAEQQQTSTTAEAGVPEFAAGDEEASYITAGDINDQAVMDEGVAKDADAYAAEE
ncbi:unnamed protein product [Amoebophrya sp. A25]|nr:unnamed protein product [Amoebophrya sp. A25]|eukprot:GSA25T00005467001.1